MLMVMESPVKYFQSVERKSFQVMVLPDGAAALRGLVITVHQKAI